MTIRLKSDNGCIAELEVYVKSVFDAHDISADLYPNVLISLTEAVNNAIKHGNNSDHSKTVLIRTIFKEDKVCCVISDEGPGFDYENLPDPTAPENLEKLGGRGVFLMKQLSDRVHFSDNGSTVELEFYK